MSDLPNEYIATNFLSWGGWRPALTASIDPSYLGNADYLSDDGVLICEVRKQHGASDGAVSGCAVRTAGV